MQRIILDNNVITSYAFFTVVDEGYEFIGTYPPDLQTIKHMWVKSDVETEWAIIRDGAKEYGTFGINPDWKPDPDPEDEPTQDDINLDFDFRLSCLELGI